MRRDEDRRGVAVNRLFSKNLCYGHNEVLAQHRESIAVLIAQERDQFHEDQASKHRLQNMSVIFVITLKQCNGIIDDD
jgi:hypothetical protein